MRKGTFILAALCIVSALAGSWPAAAQERTGAPHKTFGLACERCHNTGAWSAVKNDREFDHGLTAFPLEGEHADVKCGVCHHGQGLAAMRQNCASCHVDKHRAEFGDACENCHTPTGWRNPGRFIVLHEATQFPLLGAHRLTDCRNCHANREKGEFAPIPHDCAACHGGDYRSARIIDHAAMHFPLQCEQCHKVEQPRWSPAAWNHSVFPLAGAHAQLDCNSCHHNGYGGTPANCIDCHQADFNSARNPDHAAGQFPGNCAACHSSAGWKPARFDHGLTHFPLTGKHTVTPCSRCHPNDRYTGTPTDCAACHLPDYDAAKNPDHAQGSYPQQCEKCHTTAAWTPASIDHNTTRFPLQGAHTSVECARCHTNNRWSGLSTDCIACHQADFIGATNPNHQTAKYPSDCTVCHTMAAWRPSTFDHDARYFPIYSGKHRQAWKLCSDCHTIAGDFKLNSCIDCHEHSKTEMDNKHRNTRNYSYNSQECFRCHPRGAGG